MKSHWNIMIAITSSLLITLTTICIFEPLTANHSLVQYITNQMHISMLNRSCSYQDGLSEYFFKYKFLSMIIIIMQKGYWSSVLLSLYYYYAMVCKRLIIFVWYSTRSVLSGFWLVIVIIKIVGFNSIYSRSIFNAMRSKAFM